MESKAEKVTAILLLLLLILNLVPPLLQNNETYFDNSFFTSMYLVLAYVSIIVPLFIKTWPFVRIIFFAVSGWFLSALLFEVINWFEPEKVYNSAGDNKLYLQCVITFTLSLAIYVIYKWKKQKH